MACPLDISPLLLDPQSAAWRWTLPVAKGKMAVARRHQTAHLPPQADTIVSSGARLLHNGFKDDTQADILLVLVVTLEGRDDWHARCRVLVGSCPTTTSERQACTIGLYDLIHVSDQISQRMAAEDVAGMGTNLYCMIDGRAA